MIELATAIAAALAGAVLDRLMGWFERQKRQQAAIRQDRLERQFALERRHAAIDREIADETDLGALVDRL